MRSKLPVLLFTLIIGAGLTLQSAKADPFAQLTAGVVSMYAQQRINESIDTLYNAGCYEVADYLSTHSITFGSDIGGNAIAHVHYLGSGDIHLNMNYFSMSTGTTSNGLYYSGTYDAFTTHLAHEALHTILGLDHTVVNGVTQYDDVYRLSNSYGCGL